MAKATQKQPKKQSQSKPQPISLKKRLGLLLLKIIMVLSAIIVIYGIYLDQQIKERIDGNVWELPVAVYGQIVDLEPGSSYTKQDVISVLNGAQYRQVLVASRPGEFVVNANNIEIYRRPFAFPDGSEPAYRVKISFNQNAISQITNIENGRGFGVFRIDPKLITMMHSPNGEQRLFVPLKEFPDALIQTLIATEDKRFYEHDGVSVYSIGRAIWTNLVSGRTVQGGSTLTQQLVKNLFLTNERSYIRKIREAYMAVILDSRYSKERILELYLNEVYLGQSSDEEIHGFPLASIYYFGRPVNELTLDQQALLVGIVKGASFYNPWTRPERALERRNVVLKLLEQQNIIDDELYTLLSARPLSTLPKGGVISPQPAFMQLVRQALNDQLGEQINNLSGTKVFTTFDPIAQQGAEQALVDEMAKLKNQTRHQDLQAAMVIVDRQNGEIKALIGGADPRYAGFNRALYARRPIGSLIKPATYLAALNLPQQYQLNNWLDDKPLSIKLDRNTEWQPNNFDKKYRNEVIMVDALAYSLNIPSINLGMQVGLPASEQVLQALGVPKAEIKAVPSRFLGTLELTPIEIAQMYQAITNNGQKASLSVLRYVVSDKGELIYQRYPQATQVVPAQAAYLTTYGMQQVVAYGTARALSVSFPNTNLAAKTGTTNDLRDSWFVGADDKSVAVIWVGLDNHTPMGLTGSSGALKIYQQFLQQNPPTRLDLTIPNNIVWLDINSQGNWLCDGQGVRTLPVWTTNKALLCAGFNSPVQYQQSKEQQDEAPHWLKEMFGF